MNFTLSQEQLAAIDGLRRYLDDVIEPEFQAHGEGFIPREKMQRWCQGLSDFGLINAPHPLEWGGLGLDWMTHIMLVEEVAVTSIDLCLSLALNTVCADSLIAVAPRHLQEKYLPGLLKGELFGSAGISEPGVGSNVAGVTTRAVREGDDWIINGEKTWITNGEYSDFLICTCKTDEGELTHILIDREEHGYEVCGIPKMALNGQSTAQIFLSDVRVPISNTLGEVGSGLKNTLVLFERARCHMAVWGYGLARRAMEEAIRYSQERIQWGKPIAGHQLIAAKLATMATEIDAARLLTLRAVALIDAGQRCDKECAMAKWYATELAVRATRDAIQIHGGNGVTRGYIVERLAREAIIAPIPDGTTEIQKLLISRSLTGIQAFI